MKRDKNLETLSWEHHDALVSAYRLKAGVEKKADVSHLRDYLLYIWANDLPHHFEQEEQALIERIRDKEGSQLVVERVLAEHKRFAVLAQEVEAWEGDVFEKIREFAVLLKEHVRFEERNFFPFVEENTSVEELAKIGAYLRDEHIPACKTWQPEFWK